MGIISYEKKAFRLIEICISIVIVLIILASMLRIFSQGYWYLRKSRMQTIACFLAQEKMEENSVWPPPDGTGTHTEDYGNIADFPDFKRVVVITDNPISTLPSGSLKQLEVTVYWQGQKEEQSLTLESLKANY